MTVIRASNTRVAPGGRLSPARTATSLLSPVAITTPPLARKHSPAGAPARMWTQARYTIPLIHDPRLLVLIHPESASALPARRGRASASGRPGQHAELGASHSEQFRHQIYARPRPVQPRPVQEETGDDERRTSTTVYLRPDRKSTRL